MKKILKKLMDIFKKKYGQILLILVLLVISILSIRWGKYLLSNDNYSPELNPSLSISRYLESPAWRSYRVLGFASDSEQSDIFRSIFFSIGDIFLPQWILAQGFAILALIVGTLSMATLTTYFIRDFVNTKISSHVFLVSGLIYLSTLWTAWVFNFNMMPYIAQYGFLPLLLLSQYLFMKNLTYKNAFFLFISSILFTSVSVIGTLFFVNIVLIGITFVYFGYIHRVKMRGIIKSILIFLSTQIFWLFPFIQYSISTSGDIISSYTNRSITSNTIDLEADMMTLVNSSRFYTRLLGTVDDSSTNSYIFSMSEEYMNYDIYKVIGLIPVLLSLVGIIFSIVHKKYKLIPIWIVMFTILFLIKNQNPPLGGIYLWLQENFNIFKQVFRWISSKLSQQYLIPLTITATIGFIYILNFLSSFFHKLSKKIFIAFSFVLITIPLLFYAEYMFKGELFTERATVSLPTEYSDLAEYLEDDPYSRIYYAPPSNNGYFRENDWGFVGSQFISYIIPNPIMDMSLAIGSDVGENAMIELANIFDSGNTELLNGTLLKYDVKYILVDTSLIKGRYGYSLDWELLDSYTESWDSVWTENFLALYKLEDVETKYTEYLGESNSLENGTFIREYPDEPEIIPLNLDISDAYLNGSYLTKTFSYTGISTTLYSRITEDDISNAPIYVKREKGKIVASPSFPTLNNLENDSYREFKIKENSSNYYIVGNTVLEESDIQAGVSVDYEYGNLDSIYTVDNTSLVSYSLTDRLSESLPGDCSGTNYTVLPDVSKEEISSGFLLKGHTESPCVYTDVRLDKRMSYVGNIELNWEPSKDTTLGYCLYSKESGGCINTDKYLYSESGYGQATITIPKIIYGGDNISLTIYALNTLNREVSVSVRDVKLNLSPVIEQINSDYENTDLDQKMLSLEQGSEILLKIPILYGQNSYIYTGSNNNDVIWQPNIAEDGTLKYITEFSAGMKQNVQSQYLNQYQKILEKVDLGKYLWYWSGANTKNIPASLCLTYSGDDRCWVDDVFYSGEEASSTRIFLASDTISTELDASYNSISFSEESENILHDFILMRIPEVWFNVSYSTSLINEYSEIELSSNSASSTLYRLDDSVNNISRNTLITIPQARSSNWVAVGIKNWKIDILGNDQKVYINGWKQGWDIKGVDYDTFFVFYWPNLLSYAGYLLIVIMFLYLLNKIIKENKYGRR